MAIVFVIVFNSSDRQIEVDDNGRCVYPHEWEVAEEDFVKSHIKSGALTVLDPKTIDPKRSNETVIILKNEADRRNREADAEKADDGVPEPDNSSPAKPKKK